MSGLGSVLARLLHIGEHPVTDADRAEAAELRGEVDAQRRAADRMDTRAVGLSRYFGRVMDENHFAERLRSALRGG